MITSISLQQLQQDLSEKNMLFSKDFVELSKVIGQGEYLSMCAILCDQDNEWSVLISEASWLPVIKNMIVQLIAGQEKQDT